jgi:uncharacterized protein YxjI
LGQAPLLGLVGADNVDAVHSSAGCRFCGTNVFGGTATVEVAGPDDLEVKGDFTDHEYEFWRQSGLKATVSKQWFAWTDTYGVDIAEGEDDILILASTVVIDMACHGDHQRR